MIFALGFLRALLPRLDADAVVRAHAQPVHRQLRRIFGPEADVDDVFQMVMLEILRSLPAFAGRSSLGTWIRRITLNVAYQEMRQQYRRARVVPLEEPAGLADPTPAADEGLRRRQSMTRLYRALEALHPKQRMPVLMHDVEGMTLKEIGAALGRPLATVASQLYAGRAQLATALADLRGDAAISDSTPAADLSTAAQRGESAGDP